MATVVELHRLPLGTKAFIVVAPIILGGTIPFFGLTNLIWGSLYGSLGVWFHQMSVPHPLWTDLVWVIGWPIVVMATTGSLAGLAARLAREQRALLLGLYGLSLIALVPAEPIVTAPAGGTFAYQSLPLYVRLIQY